VVLEINTWVWIGQLGRKYGTPMSLANVPEQEWDTIASLGIDAVWLMGVWERSPAGIAISMQNPALRAEFKRVLPDFTQKDNVGSPYCVRRYEVDEHLGGAIELASARAALRTRGIRLMLDFVSNHVAPDHPWVTDHPEFFIHESDGAIAAGRDPFFPAWPDVLQLNIFHPGLRHAVLETVHDLAQQCDGIRCDMAMLALNSVFERTWGARAGARPTEEYWAALIPVIKEIHPEFRFIAEAYWDLEWELQQQGFDHCYDKKLYDRLLEGDVEQLHLHLAAKLSYQQKLMRFVENHDEPRAAATFSSEMARAAAVAMFTLPGAKLLHQGQMEGFKVRWPVFLARGPEEPIDQDLECFYRRLVKAIDDDVFRNGEWQLCERSGWSDNQSCRNIFAWCWKRNSERRLIVINFSRQTAQARVHLKWDELRERSWRLDDGISGTTYERSGDEMRNTGLYVDLQPWECHLFGVRTL
jgi:glycosidase